MRKEINCVTGEITEHEDAPVIPQTPAELQQEVNNKARAYLASTDWYVLRELSRGTPVPQPITDARLAAANSVKET